MARLLSIAAIVLAVGLAWLPSFADIAEAQLSDVAVCKKGKRIRLRPWCKGKETQLGTLGYSAEAATLAAAALVASLKTAYAASGTSDISPGFCVCALATCNEGDFLLNCGSEILPRTERGFLTASGESDGVCKACGCATGLAGVTIEATAICLDL